MSDLVIYGSYGYTGDLIARLAVEQGYRPILAGRDQRKLAAQADDLGLDHVAFPLDDAAAAARALADARAVLHCAGPFSHTAQPMVDACLRAGVHYLDITGEIDVFEALAARSREAAATGVVLMPGVGFDVVPSDCLAAHLQGRLPTATHLALAIRALGSFSQGTAATAVQNLDRAGRVRAGGRIVDIPAGSRTRMVDFGRGPVKCVALPLGDLSTAYRTTGIPNIEVYFAFPRAMRRSMVATRRLGRLMMSRPVQAALKAAIRTMPSGPSAAQRARGLALLWGEVVDGAGRRCVSTMRTPETYHLTAVVALAAARRVLAGEAAAGFQTPAGAFGADFILEFDGVEREDVE